MLILLGTEGAVEGHPSAVVLGSRAILRGMVVLQSGSDTVPLPPPTAPPVMPVGACSRGARLPFTRTAMRRSAVKSNGIGTGSRVVLSSCLSQLMNDIGHLQVKSKVRLST